MLTVSPFVFVFRVGPVLAAPQPRDNTAIQATLTLNLLGGRGSVRLSEKVTYIFRLQQQEADAVAINKIDLLS